jgi:hypothetical protein
MNNGHRATRRPTFVLRLRGESGVDDIRALRAILKVLLRKYRWRCVSIRPESADSSAASPQPSKLMP